MGFIPRQDRRAYVYERERKRQAWGNGTGSSYIQPQWQPFGPQPTSHLWPPLQTAPPSVQSQKSYRNLGQAFSEFHRLHQYNTEQLRQHQNSSMQVLQSLLVVPPAVTSGCINRSITCPAILQSSAFSIDKPAHQVNFSSQMPFVSRM